MEGILIDDCIRMLEENGFSLNKVSPIMKAAKASTLPDIANPAVQQLISQLLLRDDFNEFVDELGRFLDDFQTNMSI